MKGDYVMTKVNAKAKENKSFKEKIEKYLTDNAMYFLISSCMMNGSFYTMMKYGLLDNSRA